MRGVDGLEASVGIVTLDADLDVERRRPAGRAAAAAAAAGRPRAQPLAELGVDEQLAGLGLAVVRDQDPRLDDQRWCPRVALMLRSVTWYGISAVE